MNNKKEPYKEMTEKGNGLSSTQEVLYQEEFRKAGKVKKDEETRQDNELK